jgi:glycosyltransferase involved in cell wall biosynthesis
MTCEAYILNWQEDLLHLTVKHYQEFCQSITVFDNYSTDGSDKVAEEMGCKVVKFGRKGELSDAAYLRIKNYCWKQSTADWVIIVDADEILYHPDLINVLTKAKENNDSIFTTVGYQIFSERLPRRSFLEIKYGFPDESYSKTVIFNPQRITDIRYSYGAHKSAPSGQIQYAENKLYVLHYRNIGGADRLIARHGMYRKRMSADNKRLGLGSHYQYDDERRRREWYDYLADSRELSLPGI